MVKLDKKIYRKSDILEIVFGVIAGIVASLGMGGGTILILLLDLFTKLNQHTVQATNLIFFIFVAITSGIINSKRNLLNKKIIIKYSLLGGIGAFIGAKLANIVNSKSLKKYFGSFLLTIAIFEVYEFFKQYKKDK